MPYLGVIIYVLKGRLLYTQFRQLFQQNFKKLCCHAVCYVRDEEVAKDIVHDVFIGIWNHWNEIDFSRPIYPYLLSLTRNRCLNYLEHKEVETRHKQYCMALTDMYDSNTQEQEELIEKIVSRIDQLPKKCSEVMRLYFLECKKYKEIADQLDISVNTVKTHIATGLKILRNEFPASLLFVSFFEMTKK